MFDKIKAIWALFRQGEVVANPKAWKTGQITTTALAGFFMALVYAAKAFGYDIPVDPDTAASIAGGIIAGVNVVLTVITSKHAGFPVSGQPSADPVPAAPAAPSAARTEAPAASTAPAGVSRISDDTRKRAEEFLKRAGTAGNPADRDFQAP